MKHGYIWLMTMDDSRKKRVFFFYFYVSEENLY